MSGKSDQSAAPTPRGVAWRIAGASAVLIVAATATVVMIFDFIADERQRELRAWQTRLGIVAESRAKAVDDWLAAQFAEISAIAGNESVKLYVTQLTQAGGNEAAADSPEAGYLRNLLVVTAGRTGFAAPPLGPDVPANVRREGVAGIAILDMEGGVLAATRHYPALDGAVRAFLPAARRGQPALFDLRADAGGAPAIGFAAPIFAVQGNPTAEDQIGVVLGIKRVAGELYPMLDQPGAGTRTAESFLVRGQGAVVRFLSPLADGTPALEKTLARNTAKLSAATALAEPGGFGATLDYRGTEVLATSRALDQAAWVLVHKIDRAEAMAASEARLTRLLVFLLLTVALVVAAILAAWRHGASRRAGAAARKFEEMAKRFAGQRDFLRLLTDNQPNAIFIVDEHSTYKFANEVAAARAGIAKDDMVGKSMASVLGPVQAEVYERLDRDALESGQITSALHRGGANGSARIVQSKHVPLGDIGEAPRDLLVVEEDVTAAITERERRERTLRRLVETLVTVVDRRDPSASRHSARVAEVARTIAEEMDIGGTLAETAEFAGSLLNLGKILVPASILTREGALSGDEMRRVRASIQASADLIGDVEFDGPVAETLRQCQERWDGAGTPRGLKGEDILLTARIVHVANAFVAMVSPRAHRAGLNLDEALGELMAQSGAAFDRRVVAALVNHAENRDGVGRWAELAAPPPA